MEEVERELHFINEGRGLMTCAGLQCTCGDKRKLGMGTVQGRQSRNLQLFTTSFLLIPFLMLSLANLSMFSFRAADFDDPVNRS